MRDRGWRLVSIGGSVLAAVVFGGVLFASAGTFDWTGAWIWLVMLLVSSVIFSTTMDTGLIKERFAGVAPNRKRTAADAWGIVVAAFFFVWLALMGLDAVRYGWSSLSMWTAVLGATVLILANVLIYSTLRVNRFASSLVRVQDERGQTVVTDGPYAFVRHPMYSGVLLFCPGTALVLGSLYGLALCAPIFMALAMRTRLEDRMLHAELAGYAAYARAVRFRLVPNVW